MSIQPTIDYIDKDGFRANVGIVLTRGSGEVFLGGRVGGRGWQFPQGGVNRGEQVEEALFRELKEEIGLEPGDVEVLGSTRGLVAVSPAAAIRARPLHRAEAALVSVAAHGRRIEVAIRLHRHAGVRPLALGGLLDARA